MFGLLARFGSILRGIRRRAEVDAEMSEEFRFHVERRAEDLVRAGIAPAEAKRRARVEFGSAERYREEGTEARGLRHFDDLRADLRHALRTLRKRPVFATVAILSLALGIGANAALFGVVDAVLLRSLPVPRPEQLVVLGHRGGTGPGSDAFPYSSFTELRERSGGVVQLAAYHTTPINAGEGAGEPLTAAQLVSGNYFQVLGVRAALGRVLTPEDDLVAGAHPVCVISHGFWARRFGGDPAVIGRALRVNGVVFTIVGVTARGFFGFEVGRSPDVTVPLAMQPVVMPGVERLTEQTQLNDWLHVFGRLGPGVGRERARSTLQAQYVRVVDELVTRFAAEDASFREHLSAQRLTLARGARGLSDLRTQLSGPIRVLMAFVALVLLAACANVAGLLVAQAAARKKEMSVRVAIGAGRVRLLRQLLAESGLLAAIGALSGLLLAYWSAPALLAFLPRSDAGVHVDLRMDLRMLGFVAGTSVLATLLVGVAPALAATRVDLASALRERMASPARSGGTRPLGNVLVTVQVAFCVLLLVAAGLLAQSLHRLMRVDYGFRPEQVLVTRLVPAGSDRKTPELAGRYDRLLRRIETIPGVRAASLIAASPIARDGWAIPGGGAAISVPHAQSNGNAPRVPWMQVYPGAFAVLGIPLVAGRDFGPADVGRFSARGADNTASPPGAGERIVALINEALARQLFGGENAVAKQFDILGRRGERSPVEIVGVVRDARFTSLRDAAEPMFFLPFSQANTGRGQMTLLVEVGGDAAAVASAVRAEVETLDPRAPPFTVEPLADQVAASLARERLLTLLAVLFGLLSLALASIGIYGLLATVVAQRTGEVGLRMALGATPRNVLHLVMGEALWLVGAGLLVGLPAALASARWLSAFLFDVGVIDAATLLAVIAVMLGAAALAAYPPARRAARIDPLLAMRSD